MHRRPNRHRCNRLALQLYHASITVPGPSCHSHIGIVDARTEGAQGRLLHILADYSNRITDVVSRGNNAESSNNRKAYCYYCRQEGHYSNQCPTKSYDKRPTVNMVVAEVADLQQVTTRSKGKATKWEAQEAIWKQATEWVKKPNERNIAELAQQNENTEALANDSQPENARWQALQDCQIMLPIGRLLQLVPRFTEGLKTDMTTGETPPAPTFFSNQEEGPMVVDTNSPTITTIVKGKELPGTVIDGGSGVNVISLRTCTTLGIQEWEPCPFWLRMADTSSMRPTGLIRDLEVTIGSRTFRISAIVLQLKAQGAYPLLLGRPWLKMAHIKQN